MANLQIIEQAILVQMYEVRRAQQAARAIRTQIISQLRLNASIEPGDFTCSLRRRTCRLFSGSALRKVLTPQEFERLAARVPPSVQMQLLVEPTNSIGVAEFQ